MPKRPRPVPLARFREMREQEQLAKERKRAAELRAELAAWAKVPLEQVRIVRSPYRICPLGAHVDHQLGEVTGMALDRALLLAFARRDDRHLVLKSHQFPGVKAVPLGALSAEAEGDWADYARGASFALQRRRPLERGMTAIVDGHDNVGGLSSSAAAGVAYLLALEAANELHVSPTENIELDQVIENDYIGVNNGILDQSTILLSRDGHLTHVDCESGEAQLIPFGGTEEFSVAVLFSGLRVRLPETDYNKRVRECDEAAAVLLEATGVQVHPDPKLGDVSPEAFEEHAHLLPEEWRKRAVHFFTEQDRVRRGVELWKQGDLEAFGQLVNESGRSSIENYECGNAYLRTAYEVLRDCPGVYGARFSGAGFRGCCIGLARPECEEEIARAALSAYLEAHPDMEGKAEVYFCRPADGAGLLDQDARR